LASIGYDRKLQRWGYLFIFPTILLFSVFLIYSILNSFHLAFFQWGLLDKKVFVGLKNFASLLQDKRFWHSYSVTLHFSLVTVAAITFFSFWLALALSSPALKFRNVLQSMIFVPVVLMEVAIAVAWKFMYQSTGLLSAVFAKVLGLRIQWLDSTQMAPYSMILVYFWRRTGFYMVMFIAGLFDIPSVYYEAATIDGAGFWAKLIHITIPQLKNTIILVVVSATIFTFGTFAVQFVMTGGGPAAATEVLTLLVYKQAFEYTKFGYASAISVFYFLTLLVFSLVQLNIFKSRAEG
jgi:ABC-type sugar transport system permease subunit